MNDRDTLDSSLEAIKEEEILEVSEGKMMKEILDFVKDLVIIIALVVIIRSFIVLPFQIKGQSMYDSYFDRGFIIVDRFSYLDIPNIKQSVIKRGDVIVFRPHVNKEKEYYIKRVIGLPGDQIKIADGKVYLKNEEFPDWVELNELYLSEENMGSTFVKWEPVGYIFQIPEKSYFVMWDNRLGSTDSRSCFSSCSIEWRTNYIVKDDIIWKVWVDLGYFNFKKLDFVHPTLGIETYPRWFSSPSYYDYQLNP